MCIAVKWQNKTIYFKDRNAILPIVTYSTEWALVKWGRRLNENSKMPFGKRLWLSEVGNGKFDKFFPSLVELAVDCF